MNIFSVVSAQDKARADFEEDTAQLDDSTSPLDTENTANKPKKETLLAKSLQAKERQDERDENNEPVVKEEVEAQSSENASETVVPADHSSPVDTV